MEPSRGFSEYRFYAQAFGALDLLWNRDWNREDFATLEGIFQWKPANHLLSFNGKNSVRLFQANSWRTLVVDNRCPESTKDLAWLSILLKALWKVNFEKGYEIPSFEGPLICDCTGSQRKKLPVPLNFLDPLQLLTGWLETRNSVKFLENCEKWNLVTATVGCSKEKELVVLEVELGGVIKLYEVLDVRFYPHIRQPRNKA